MNNWNFCLNKAKGEYFLMLSDDDELYHNCLEDLLEGFVSDQVSISLGKAHTLNSNNSIVSEENKNIFEMLDGDFLFQNV